MGFTGVISPLFQWSKYKPVTYFEAFKRYNFFVPVFVILRFEVGAGKVIDISQLQNGWLSVYIYIYASPPP